MRFIPFRPEHITQIKAQPIQAEHLDYGTDYAYVAASGVNITGVAEDGTPLCCGGVVALEPGKHVLWGLFSEDAGRGMMGAFRVARRMLMVTDGLVVAMVKKEFEQGHRLIKMLGFSPRPDLVAPIDGVDVYMRSC